MPARPKKTPKPKFNVALVIAVVVAAVGIVALLLVDYGPWNQPVVQAPTVAPHTETAAAAKAAGATVAPTDPKPAIEPTAPGPKPAQPAVPK